VTVQTPRIPGEPALRWESRASTIAGIEHELARIWSEPKLTTEIEGVEARHVAARTSVMNLVVIARRPEVAEHCAMLIRGLMGRLPSRTIICTSADPDGPSWLDARVTAQCVLPRADAPETCAETIFITAGGETGRHLDAIVEPLLIHDLPVAIWWPAEPSLSGEQARDLLDSADRLIIDGSSWSDDGVRRFMELAALAATTRVTVADFAQVRQSRWREAIASTFDVPEFLPYLRSLRRIAVTYATHDEAGRPGSTNLVKPLYHVAWLASRLGFDVARPLTPLGVRGGPAGHSAAAGTESSAAGRPASARARTAGVATTGRGYGATLRDGTSEVAVLLRPVVSTMPAGTTLRVELLAERRGSELRVDVTAEAETVMVRVWQDGVEVLDRRFGAPRRTEMDLLAEAIESGGRDRISDQAVAMAAKLAAGLAG
jgi:glucose-6-phosphate dehydrogenase assembly protein OpcA